ncbi:hypothetical protein QFZ28_004344 [Neobacillus niacini]|uniref:hypothetical protein n=1 Tax=Neobacillus niacini TaxID=86668 RepID=UPI00278B41C8|nr:hypothetical protein [Neobacillus niacini]MDQ1003944.1 hypothetical protein [Neobacillus niacini]
MTILNIRVNGILQCTSSLDYDCIHQIVEDNTYDSIGNAAISKISDAIHNSQWYDHTPINFDLVHNFNDVQAICNNNIVCYMDSFNWSIMNKTELTADIFKFISHRMSVIREGFTNNFLPDYIDFGAILDFIDWQFILNCISWFL